jgi:hypothetical protein
MKSFRLLRSMVLLGALVISAAYGQPGPRINVNVPFDFQIGEKAYSAGPYTVKAGPAATAVLVQSTDMRRAQFILTSPAKARTSISQPSLVFKRYGKDYFLSEIWLARSDTGRQLPPGRKETELARWLSAPDGQTVLGALERPKR